MTQSEWVGWLGAIALNLAINYAVLAVAGLLYAGVVLGGIRLAVGSRGWVPAFARGLVSGTAFATLALPTYIAIGTLVRHDALGPRGLERPLGDYVPGVMVAFFAVEAAAVLIATAQAARPERSRAWTIGSAGRGWIPAAAAIATIGFLILTWPLAEFANACYIGTGFILKPQC